MTLSELRHSISDMSDEKLMKKVKEIRASRRIPMDKLSPKKTRQKTAKTKKETRTTGREFLKGMSKDQLLEYARKQAEEENEGTD